jgi:hypothetical protein
MDKGSKEQKLNKSGDKRGTNSKLSDPNIKRGWGAAKLNRVQKEELTDKIIDWIVAGHSNVKITDLVQQHSPEQLSKSNAQTVLYYAMNKLEELTKEEVTTVIFLHIGYCERIYEYAHEIDNITLMNKAMKHKEDLMKLGQNITVNVNQKKTTIIERKVEYNLDKLTGEQKNRLEQLHQKMSNK